MAGLIGFGGGFGCSGAPEQVEEQKVEAVQNPDLARVDRVQGVAVVRLTAPGFEALPQRQKLLAYHLTQAALAGRDIGFDQANRHSLAIRAVLDAILSHRSGLDPEVEARIREYAQLFWLNNGPYWERTKEKIRPAFTREELATAVGVAIANGATLPFDQKELAVRMAAFEPTLFDPLYQRYSTQKNPPPGVDPLLDSGVNYYMDVSMADLEGFTEKYPLNSRLVKTCKKKKCTMTEEVYRTGIKDEKGKKWQVEPGLYAEQLERVIGHLTNALPYAEPGQDKAILALIRFFRTGEQADFDAASIAWLAQDPQVDLILGFIETYKDPRSRKGHYEGIVYYKDAELSSIMETLANHAQELELNCPWDDKYKKQNVKVPVAGAINVVAGFGHGGPFMPAGINLPNAQWIREQHGSRSVLLTNVMLGARNAVADTILDEFAPVEDREAARRYRDRNSMAMVSLHEVIGHGSGKVSVSLAADPSAILGNTYSTLEEARAELVALHSIGSELMVEWGVIPNMEAARAAYADYVRGGLVMLRRVKNGDKLQDDHMRATNLIVQYLLASGAAAIEVRDGVTFFVLKDFELAKKSVAELLSEIMRIKAEGDVEAAQALVQRYAVNINPKIRDEVVLRCQKANVPDFVAFHSPALKLVLDDKGDPVDVELDYSRDFTSTMLQHDLVN